MILGQVSWLDCFVFLIFLAPQLILRVGFFPTLFCGLQALPFLLLKLPLSFIYERFFLARHHQTPFVQKASWFEDIVIRCVRYAFANIPASIGRVFFSKPVALPFLRFRMLRHGYIRSPIHWHEVKEQNFTGLWITANPTIKPDLIIYYVHGGGFSMGSSYFYLEFLITLLTLLSTSTSFTNPAILSLEYTLVPDATYPTQLHEALAGYAHAVRVMRGDASRVCVAGDSAGGTIVLSMLLRLGEIAKNGDGNANGDGAFNAKAENEIEISGAGVRNWRPGMAVLISPWITLHLDPTTQTPHTAPT
ncbi:Monoterpene epsilon-lactone hydrolase, partial [Lachnellula willkommii]